MQKSSKTKTETPLVPGLQPRHCPSGIDTDNKRVTGCQGDQHEAVIVLNYCKLHDIRENVVFWYFFGSARTKRIIQETNFEHHVRHRTEVIATSALSNGAPRSHDMIEMVDEVLTPSPRYRGDRNVKKLQREGDIRCSGRC